MQHIIYSFLFQYVAQEQLQHKVQKLINLPKTYNHEDIKALKAYCFNHFRDNNIILRYDTSAKEDSGKKHVEVYEKYAAGESNYQYNEFMHHVFLIDKMFEDC